MNANPHVGLMPSRAPCFELGGGAGDRNPVGWESPRNLGSTRGILESIKVCESLVDTLIRLLLLTMVCLTGASTTTAEEEGPTRVLFIGNSYLYYNDSLHNHVERLAQARYPDTPTSDFVYKSATLGGAQLKHHNIDWLLEPKRLGLDKSFQAVIMQGASFEPLTEQGQVAFIETAVAYSNKVRGIGAIPYLYMTHAYVAPHKSVAKHMIRDINETYTKAGLAANARVIPVGLAFERAYQERPAFLLHADFDGTHPNLRGTFLGAWVVYLTLYGDDATKLNYDYFGRLPQDEVRFLQRIARETVAVFNNLSR
jgi:hypothetical protein